jgi:hypothetical protein
MEALIQKILQRIIHKPMALNAALAGKRCTLNTHTEMRTYAGGIRTHMAGMLVAFVDHFQLLGRKAFA